MRALRVSRIFKVMVEGQASELPILPGPTDDGFPRTRSNCSEPSAAGFDSGRKQRRQAALTCSGLMQGAVRPKWLPMAGEDSGRKEKPGSSRDQVAGWAKTMAVYTRTETPDFREGHRTFPGLKTNHSKPMI